MLIQETYIEQSETSNIDLEISVCMTNHYTYYMNPDIKAQPSSSSKPMLDSFYRSATRWLSCQNISFHWQNAETVIRKISIEWNLKSENVYNCLLNLLH